MEWYPFVKSFRWRA